MDPKPGPNTIATLEVDIKRLAYLVTQIEPIVTFFEARDQMNANVHLAGTRLSPITLKAHELRNELEALWEEASADLKA
jgi:hypothetical protein